MPWWEWFTPFEDDIREADISLVWRKVKVSWTSHSGVRRWTGRCGRLVEGPVLVINLVLNDSCSK